MVNAAPISHKSGATIGALSACSISSISLGLTTRHLPPRDHNQKKTPAEVITIGKTYLIMFCKKFSFPKIKMQFEPIFLEILWQFLSARRSRDFGISRGPFLAPLWRGENRPNYFKNRPPFQICRRSCLGASPLGIGFRQEIPGGFEFRQKHSRRKSAVRADGNKKISHP